MKDVKVNKEELLVVLRANRIKHVADYEQALIDYKEAVVKVAKDNLKLANSGDLSKIARIRPMFAPPVNYETSYTRAIRMLEMSVDGVIELEESLFNQLVLDEWAWKQSFATTTQLYKSL